MFDSRRNECEISIGKSWRGKDTIYDKRWCTWWVPLRGMTCAILPRQQVYAERKVAKPWRVHRFRLLNRIKSTREVSSSVPFRWSFTSRSGSSTFSSRERNNKRNNHVFTSLELKIDGREKRCAKTHTHTHAHTTVGGERSRWDRRKHRRSYTQVEIDPTVASTTRYTFHTLRTNRFPPTDWYSRRL